MAKILKAIGNALGIGSKGGDGAQAASREVGPDFASGAPRCEVPATDGDRRPKGRSCCSGG